MAGDNNQNNQNKDLNDAVEQTETNDAGTPSQQQNQQNQQNTIASTVATGAENTDAADEANQAMEDNPSGAGTEEEASASGGAVQEDAPESSGGSDAAQSNVVDSVASDGGSGEEATGSGGAASGAGAQAVGGGDASGSEGGSDAEGNEAQGQAVQTSAAPSASSSDSEGSQGGDNLDSETTEETFAVDVQDTSEETTTQVEDDFDSETTSETFQIKVEGENDAPEVEQDLAYIMDEDGTITFTQEQLLEYASDVDGDDLVASNVQVGANASVQDNGDGTFTVVPDADFNGELDLTFDISDGQETVSSSIDLTVRPINDAPVPEDKTFEVEEDGTLIFTDADLLAGATDIEGDDLTVEGVSYDGGDGILTDNGNGTYTFAPNENFNGDVNFSFDVSDGTDTVSANIDVSVTPVDDAPVSGNLAYSVDEDGSIRLSQEQLLSQASDVEGDALTASNLSVDGNATVTQNDDGSFTITPDADFNGDIDISFDISDGTNTVQATADLTVNPINDLPVPQDQQFSVEEDGTLQFTDADLLTGATDIEGDNLTVEGVSYDGGDGILTDNGNGTYTFAPNENFNGDVNFSFDVSDGTDTVSANIDVSVTPVDDAPVSGNLAYSVDEDGSIRLSQEQLLSQASDVEGDALTASNLSVDGNATVTQNDDGSFTITPDADFNGDIDISFDISDGTNTVQATADLTVNPINDLPVPQYQQFSVEEDGTLQFTDEDLLAGATDIEGDDLSVTGISYEGTDGVLTDNGDGTYSFAPNENFNGDVNFSFDVSDGTDTVSANVDVSVTPVNDPPVAGSTSYTVHEDNSITISDAQLLANSSDLEGDVSIDSVSYSGSDGVLQINGDGTYTFSPNENFNGEVTLDVVVADEEGATDATTAGITVLEVNDPPVAGPTSYTIDEDSVLTFSESQVLLNASDVEGDVELVGISYDGPDGIFTVNDDGTCSFAPNENFNGQVQLDVTIRDEDGAEVDTVINVNVLPINDAPVSGDLAYSVDEDGAITLSQEQLLSQASDIEGDDLTASDLTVDGNATVTANDDGSFTITPDADFNGDIDIQFNITDGTDTIQATADLTVNPVNDLPVPQDQQFSVEEDGTLQFTDADLLAGATDIDGDNLTVDGISYTGSDGVLTDHGDGTYTFAPNENFNGDVSFSFGVSDGTETVPANVDVSVTPVNDPPVAGSTSYTVDEDNAITISDEQLLANSSDVEGAVSIDSVTYSGTDGVFQDNGDGTYTFMPNENFSGDISLDVIVADEQGAIDETTAGITVIEVNDPPVAGPTSYTIDEDSVLTFSESQILANASDIEGDVELVGISYEGSDGIFTVNGDGTCSFAPNENFNGQVQLDVTIQDENGATVDTHINVDVLPINDPPVSGDLAYTINEDSSITLSQEQLLAKAGDIDSENLEAINLSTDDNATIQYNDDGSYTITPDENYNGDLDLTFDIIDNDGGSVQVGLDITVNPVNDLPQAQDQQFTVEEDGTLLFTDADLLEGASDIDGDDLSIENVLYTGADGVLTDNGDGTYSFAPNENFNGDVQFTFDVSDGTGSTPAFIDVSVTPVNDPPVAGSTSYTVQEDGQITISDEQLLANSSDVEGDVALANVSYSGNDGSFVDNGDGTYTFTPNENFDGNISLDVTVIDQDGATDTTTAGIDVIAVNDAPETSGIQAEVDEDNAITITQEQLLANATDIEGDDLVASNLQTNDPDATIVANDDGSFTITHTENFNGELDFTYNISDGENDVLTTLDLTVNPVNDAPEAGDEIFIQAEEDQTVGVSLREEPALRLDQAPENGIIEANLNDEWVQLEVGQEVPADTEVRFIPNDDALANGTHTTQIGTFDDNASVDDWGDEIDPYTRQFTDGDLTVTVQSNDDPLGAWNGNTHIGHGIGDTDRQGLSGDEKLTVTVEGQDINEISFHLDGLGGWFMEESRHFTEVEIRAFNSDGDLIDSMTYHKEDRGSYETDYTLTVNEPVSYFELGTIQGNGTYVVQNMTVSQTCHDEAVFTSIGVDGTEITETVELNIREGDSEIELTADLPNVTIDTEGSTQFASVVITEEQLLAQASDIDSDVLDIQNLELVGDNAEHATLTDNGDGTWTVTPDENFYGEIELGYQVTDGELTDDNIININFEAVNDAPIVSGPIVLSTDEDVGITFSADDLLANASDVEGDALSISDISYSGDNGELVDNGDGTYTFMPNENFNGEVDIDYKVFDGTDEVDTHLDLTVIPVNDVPVPGAPLHTQMLENGTIIIEAKDLLSGATDVDGDILHIENLLLVDQSQGTLTDNGDNTFTFEPTSNFYGEVNLTFDISDGQASAPSTAKIDVEIVNEGPEVSGPVDAVVDEDGSITITQEDLLANATDVDGDNLEAVNLSTNDPNATIVENADGSFTITPSENFFGEIEFTYDVTDAIETVAADLNLTVNPVNDLPDVPDLSFTTEDGEAITITEAELLAQATDIEGDELSVVNVTSLSDTVQVTDNGDGTYTLTPEQGFFGNVDLTFDVSDGTDVVAANIDLKVEFVNDAPEAAPIVADVDEDGSILVTQEMLLENASDQDGDDLYATALETNDPNASIVDNGDGTFTVTPSQHFNGDIEFTYEVSDGELSVANEMTLTVNPVNDIPIVAPGMYHIEEDGSILFTQEDLLSGAIDIDGDDLTVTSINYSGDEGTVTDNGDGTFSFVPEEHFSGDLQFSFTVSDGTDEVEQDINVHIEAVADAPDLVITDGDGRNVDDQAILVEPGGIVEVNIAAALVDQDLSETLTVTVDGVPEGSVISYDNEGVLNDQDNGITSFNDTEITVTFEGETAGYQNTAGYYKVDEDGNITGVEVVYENASQVGGGGDLVPGQDQFSFQISEGESFNLFLIPNGHNFNDFASMQDGQYEFRAADGSPANMDTVDPQLVFVGADGSETVIQSQFGDAVFHGGSSSELNQDGIEHTRTTVNEDGELVYGFEDLYGGGDADYTDFNFTIDVGEVNSQIYSGEVTVGPDGSVTLPTTAIEQELQIQLPEDFNQQLEINVTATATELSNNDSETVSQTIYVNATGAHIEHAPEALPVSAMVEEDGSILITQEDLLANARDLDGDQLTALNLATDDENITITDNGDGTYTLTPDADFNGDITFTFDVSDGDDVVSTNLELLVSPVNDAPEPQDQAFTVGEDGVLTFTDADLLTGATDIEGDDLSVEGVTYTGADGVLTDNGDGTYSFAPNENFNGDVNFTFDVSDGTDTVTANIDVTVTPENDPPVAGSTAYTVHEDNSITISDEQLLANSSDIEGDVLIDSVSYSGNDGVLEINGDGTYTFSPNENFSGEVSLDVVVVDEEGATDSTTAGITVIEVNDPPIAGPTAYTIDEDQVLTFSESQVLLNASDVEGDVELVGISYDGPDGIFSVNGDGTCSFAPNENFNGQVQLDVTIRDEDGAEVDTYITVDVLPINDAPVSGNLAYSVDEDNSITLSQEQLLAQATDVEGDALTASNLVVDGDATVTANDDGSFTITPDANFNGDIDITFDINDGSDTIVATADLTVNPVNDLPQPEDQAFTIGEDGVLTFTDQDLLDGATDIDGDDLSVEGVSYTGADGVLTDNGDGTYSFAPNENFNGDVNFTFDVSDGTDTVTANIDVSVTPENDPPVAGSTSYTVHEDNSITISDEQLLANSSDVEGDVAVDSVSYSGTDGVFQDNGDGTYTFSPNENFNGEVSLDVVVVDEDGATDSTTAGITVLEVNDPPIAGATSYSVNEDEVITISSEQLVANASDVEGEVAIDSVSYSGSDGIFTDNGDGTFSFAPNANFDGNVNVTFDVNDGTATVPAEANIDVQSVVDMPELSIASDLVIASDNFESGSNGWNANTESSQGFETGDMLGRIGGTGGDEAVSKTYEIPSDVDEVNISFSFYEIDSWDGESFQIFVGGEQLTTLENSAFRTQDGTTTLYDSDGNEVGEVIHGASQREGFSGWNDQAHQINLTVPVEDGELQLGFGSTLNQSTWDESFGIDNIEITVADADYQIIGTEDTPVPLDIDAALTDTDGSENLSILIEDVPEGSALSAGVDNGDGTWSLQPGELEGLEFIPSADFNGDVTLTVNATSTDVDTGTTATATQDVTIHISPTNDAPEVTGDITAVTAEDNSITLTQEQLLEHAVDIDGDDLSAINLSTNDENATVEMNEDGSFTITPSENFYGDIEFTYDVTDGEEVVAAGLDLTVTPVNDAPEPQDQAFTVGEDGILTFTDADLLTGATDVEGDNLTVEGVTYTGADGVLSDNGDGTYSFAPNENFNGDVNFTFDVSDGTDTTSANIDVSVTPENDPPVAGSTSYTVHEDNSITISDEQLLANSSDIEGDVAISSVSYSGSDGVLEINGDGTYTFSPNENFTGDVSLDVVVVDEDGAVDTTTAGITVLEVNDPPIAGVTSYTIDEDEVITISAEQLLANSSDIEGEVALDSVSYSDSEGIFTDNGDGTFSFAPNQNFNGEVNLDVVVVDEDGATASTTANIDVLPINDAPVSGDLAYSVDEDNSITLSQEQLLAQATDVEGDALTASNLVVDGDATVTANDDGSFTITPDANFNGDIDITFDINDGTDTIVATADLTVNPVNDLPQPEDQAFTIGEDGVLTFTDQDLLDGATDIDGDDLSVEGVTYTGADGVLTDNGDGTYSFAPNENFNGDVNFTFDVSDGTDTVTANIDVSVTPENDPPVAGSTSYTVHEDNSITISDEQLLANSSDIEGDVSIDSVSYSGNDGVLEINGDGTYTFSPNENFNGEVSLDVVVVDEDGATDSTTAGLTVLEVNDPPIAGPTAYTIDEDQVLTFSESQVLLNASDVEGDVELVSISYDGPDGIFSVNGDGTCSFAPNENFNGQVSLDVTIRDEDGAEVDTYITVDVLPINDAPVSGSLAYNVDEDNTITLSQEQLLSQASDVDGDDLVAENLLVDGNATVTANDDGSFTITPDANFNGDIDITFDISDGSDTLVATADLTVNPVNDLPQPEDQAFTIGEDGVLLFTDEDLLDGATDIDGDDLSVEGVSYTGADGVLTDNGDGTYSFAPNENFNGDVNFTFDVSDGTDTVTANIDVSVTPENDPPVAGSTSYTVHEDNSITISDEQLLANSSDIEGDVSIDSVSYSGTDGVFQDNGDGTYTFSPNENFNGEVSLDVVVVDEDGATDSTTAGITVLEVNDPPIAGATSYSVNEDEVITISSEQLLANASDVEGEVAIDSVSYSGSDGIFTDNGDGTFSFAPNANFDGDVSLDVVVVDEDGATAATNANIDVLPINDAPVSGNLAYSVDEDGSITLSQEQLLAQAGDVDGDDLTASNLTVDGNATVVANDDGSFTITPDADFNGDIDLSFDITDGDATIQATADLTVNPVNDLPTVGQPQFVTQEDTSFTFTVEQLLQNAGDIDGDNLTVENVASDSGTLVDNGDGTYTFAPNENFDGNVNVTFDVNDGTATVPAEANIDVQSVVDMPELSIASDLVIASDNFESGSNGWNANTESSQGFETGDMLGRIGGTGGDEAVSKTYEIPSDVNEVNISFSFYEIDSWDGESFQIFVGGEQLTTLENSAFRTQDGTTTLYDSDGNEVGEVIHGASQREGFSGWNDQAHQINLTVPVEDGELQLGFGSTLNQDVWDESFGIDNIEITVADADYQIIGTEDTPVPLDIDAALTDTDGSENLAILIEDVPEGSALSAGVDNGDGTWSLQPGELEGLEFIPSADFNGDVTLTVNATSTDVDTGTTATATQDVTIHISPTNDAPEVTGDITAVTAEDNSITLTQEQLLEHAVDIDGDDLSAINLSTNDENATVEMNEDGSFTITPSENFYGDIEFTYDVTDGEEVVAAGLDLSVTPVNDAPEPQDQAFTVGEDGLLTFTDADLLTGATDVEGDDLTVEGVSYTGADGVLTDNGDGTYSFAPNENFNGDVNFTFDVSDGTDTTSANIDVSVTPENDPPVAGSTSYTVHEDNSITISDEQLLANSSDIEGDVDISSVTYSGNDGVFQDNGDGTYTFSPNENFNGEVSLDVVVVDEEGATDSTTAGITVLEVNDPPIAGATSYSVNEDEVIIFTEEQLLAQSSDVEGDVSLESVSYSGSDGILTANDDGTYSFAPNENFNGGVSLDVVVADEDGATATTNANIDVLPVNDAPVSGDLAYSVDEDGSITLSQEQLLAQAGDVDSDNLEAVNLTAVANATVVENQDGSFTITPDANFNGDIDLSFDLIDNDGASVEVGVDLTVNPINDAPQSTPVNIAGTEDTTILITQDMLLANATDIDNTYDELSAVDLVIDEQYGDLLDNGDGTWSFTPAENFNGDVPMSFGVSDGDLVTPVEGNLNIEAVNDAPEAPTIQMQGEEDVVMVIDPAYIADQVTDLDGDEISVESITVRAPANATLTQQPDGMYHLVTTQDFNGLVELGYTATDGEEVVEGSLNVDVIPVNDAPFNVGNAFMATDEDGAFTFDAGDLMNLFGDIDTENLVVSRIITAEGEDGGEVTDNGDGTWTFTPTGDFAGVSDLQVVVSDGEFETVLDVPVFVRPVADGAVITTDHDGPLVFGEDETGHLGLNVGLIDDSETLSNLVMTGFPVGFEVTDGVNTITITEPGQYIDLNEWDISDLQMTPPADFNGEFFVTVTATTVDYGDEPEEFEDGIDSGDFETLAGEPVILTADDLIGLAENVDADAGDEVKFVHLADRSQGEIVDNGDGTWTFNPAPGFTGEADIAYVIDKDGVLHDEQTGVVVKEDAPQENASPEIDSISTTEMAADGTLSFTNDDMLSTLSDAEGDSLSIESVSLMEGQGVIETDNQGNYQFTPAEGYTGDVQVGFIATDGENRIESFFNVDIQGEGETTTSEGYALADDGSLTLTEAQLIDELGISPSAEVLDVADANDAGFFAKSGDEEWTYWPNDDFDGNLAMDVQVNDNGEVSTQNLSIQVADDSAQSDEPQIQTAQASSEQQVGEAQQPEEQAANGADSEEESAADVTAAPGDTISISVPDEVSGNESVDYAEMSGLPDGASVSNALDNGDGSFTLSGNLNQPVSVDLPEGYEGTSEIQFQGYDELGSAVEGASGTVEVEVDDQYTMQGSAQDQQPDMAGMESGGGDWTSAGGQDQGVDFTDDSGSFDSDTQTGTDQGNDFDQSSM
ncbi:tandem-95 repeat protein [Vibrio owensii]|uniref:tandem-95 repeat protein n=1 Tax=Vibrio owensii TaxID=696485 RepID=UPI003CE4CA1A